MAKRFSRVDETRHQAGDDDKIGSIRVEQSLRRDANGAVQRDNVCWRVYRFEEPETHHNAQLSVAEGAEVGKPMVEGFWKPVGGGFGTEYESEEAALEAAKAL
jgi:hypothetical protein